MIKKITDNVYQFDPGMVNCFVIDDSGSITLIDTGFTGSEEKIFKGLAGIGRKPTDIKQIILTHLHPDHSGAAAAIQNMLHIPVYASYKDGELIKQGIGMRESMIRMPGLISWLVFNLVLKKAPKVIQPVNDIIDLADGQILPILSGLKVIYTPGHSAGHISLLLEKQQVLIAADICMNTNGLDYSILYEDVPLAKQTLKNISKYNFDIGCFGHGKPLMTNANEKMSKKFS
ncbi:MBL fold metallo-hydrolase [Mucilaginibacter sp. X4EP1]|jgi:glyoxylase-like metal-dependent hydrolase (beta-lactamase superfamily II)|uniref:MBL fold metallo-hydrolase n=1 Tax=Mucilaginibacter sp. X4EP1 TaxID=2723092 RepID=UPI002166FD01|nr:MBL fold metallo-hydrolase [Mucilaginibacter sp. X4EP1]MCS3815715.1 glyoxylase-like metal-dependent hydrolase (beta-lactamase superfamily II) [Mucilaginibacter sp. X4EP1]